MTEYLIQKPSGHVYVASEALKQRKDMFPYEMLGRDTAKEEPEAASQVSVDFESMTKQQIESYILENYQIDLDLRHSKSDLVAEANKIVESMET